MFYFLPSETLISTNTVFKPQAKQPALFSSLTWPTRIQYVHGDLCKHLGIGSSTDHPDRYSNLFLNAYINRHLHAEYLRMIKFYSPLGIWHVFIPRRSRRDIVLAASVRPFRPSVRTFCLSGTISHYLLVRFNSFLVQMISTMDS